MPPVHQKKEKDGENANHDLKISLAEQASNMVTFSLKILPQSITTAPIPVPIPRGRWRQGANINYFTFSQ